MKINLGCGDDIRSNGFINIDLQQITDDSEIFKRGDVTNLDWVCEDDSVEEVVALNILQYLNMKQCSDSLNNWHKKLKKNASIKILLPDFRYINREFNNGQISLGDMLVSTYGMQSHENDYVRCGLDKKLMLNLLENIGFNVSSIRYEGVSLYIQAEKL